MLSPMNCIGVLISWAMPEASRPTSSSFLGEMQLRFELLPLLEGRAQRGDVGEDALEVARPICRDDYAHGA